MKYIHLYLYNLMLLVSKTTNTITGGTPHESISQRVGRKYYHEGCVSGCWAILHNMINNAFFWEKNHIQEAVDGESHSKDIWSEMVKDGINPLPYQITYILILITAFCIIAKGLA